MRASFAISDLAGTAAVVAGAGASGLAAARLLASRGALVTLLDENPKAVSPDAVVTLAGQGVGVRLGEMGPASFEAARLVVLSPGIPAAKVAHLVPAKTPVIAELELASRFVSAPVLAVTGTNGKTTTVMLCEAMLQAAGKKVFTGGNIGTPLSEFVLSGESADVLVLEVSSFQLQTIETFRANAAALLNFSANHLDFHKDLEEYLSAKLRIFENQTGDDLAVAPVELRGLLEERDFTKAARAYFQAKNRFDAPNLPGAHNQANIEAAAALCAHFGVTEDTVRRVAATFAPAGHRLERVGMKNGVLFVDDSKATTVEAMRAAILASAGRISLLAGGVFKGGDLEALKPLLRERVKAVGLFGASREVFEQAWHDATALFWEPNLEAAVRRLYAGAAPGETILLSPATASFDQYTGYKARGDDFKRVFTELPGEQGEAK